MVIEKRRTQRRLAYGEQETGMQITDDEWIIYLWATP